MDGQYYVMRAILSDRIVDVERPSLGANDLRIRIRATSVNRADLLQREGHYPPPPGASPILGLECAGDVVEVGASVTGWRAGDRAMALLAGGGYAEETVVDAGSAMHVPEVLSWEEAGAIAETFLTAFLNVFKLARAKAGETLLVHGGGSGVGTAATTLAKLAGLRVIVTAGSREKCERCLAHGADAAIDYNEEDFVERAKPADVILDHIGAPYLARDLQTLGIGGRVVIIGSMGGRGTIDLDVTALLAKCQQIIGSTLRARPADEKAEIVASFLRRFGPDLEAGRVRPVIDAVFPLEEMEAAHQRMSGDHFGKIVLRID
jgi:putative PIG3 family NAD(P)H quinone oxidoreductase